LTDGKPFFKLTPFTQNICGPYTASEVMLEGNLHTHLLQTRLTPNLAAYSTIMRDEVDREMELLMPDCKGA
jgi:hypothetical protein